MSDADSLYARNPALDACDRRFRPIPRGSPGPGVSQVQPPNPRAPRAHAPRSSRASGFPLAAFSTQEHDSAREPHRDQLFAGHVGQNISDREVV